MKLLNKIAGSWKQARAYWFKAPAAWSVPGWLAVRRVFVKIDGAWKRTYIRNGIVVYALGLDQQQAPNAWGGVTINAGGFQVAGRSYNLALFNRNGELTFHGSYDIRIPKVNGTNAEIDRMANDLNSMFAGQVFVLYSFDEPKYEHQHPSLITAVTRVGSTNGIYSQDMAYRGAYILVGKVGFPKYFEQYIGRQIGEDGGGPGDPFAWISKRFTVIDNVVYLMNDNWSWGQALKRDVHTVYALGGFQAVYPMKNRGVMLDNLVQEPLQEVMGKRSFNLVKFNANNAITFNQAYDVYQDAISGTRTNTQLLITDLNAMPAGQVFVLFTFDEPNYGHLDDDLVAAVTRVDGTYTVYGQEWGYRGAYMLIAKVGTGRYFEEYIGEQIGDGDAGGDPLAAIKISFFVEGNEVHLVQ